MRLTAWQQRVWSAAAHIAGLRSGQSDASTHGTEGRFGTPAVDPRRSSLIPPTALDAALGEATRATGAPIPEAPADPRTLLDQYQALGRAESLASAALAEAARVHNRAYAEIETRALAALRAVGEGYAARMSVFADTVHGGAGWPVLTELDADGTKLYVNSFKKSGLSFEEKRALYRTRVERFYAEGGSFERDIQTLVDPRELEPGFRYDYVLVKEGDGPGVIRYAKRAPELPDPGHALLAEGGPEFRDTRVLMAGELRVVKNEDGRVLACIAACSSGHFKPRFEDVGCMVPALAALGVPKERVILSGGPDDPHAIIREIAERFSIPADECRFPPSIDEARLGLARRLDRGARRIWQR